jgi:hypothetical protein
MWQMIDILKRLKRYLSVMVPNFALEEEGIP